MPRSTRGLLFFGCAGVLSLILDQVSKSLFHDAYGVLNSGVSFGLAAGWGSLPLASSILLAGLSVWFLLTAHRNAWPWLGWVGAGLVVGGGASNVLDRWLIGAVRDPFVIPFTTLHNNLADYAIFFGLFAIFFVVTLQKSHLASKTENTL